MSDAVVSDAVVDAAASVAAPVAAAPVAAPVAAPAPTKPAARAVLDAIHAKRAANIAAKASPPVAGVPADVQSAADRWRAHETSERARVKTAAASLDADDRKLVDGEPDIGRQAALLARFLRQTDAAAAKQTAKPRAPGGPPSSSAVDFAAALKDPSALADAKARDPVGFTKFFSDLLKGSSRKSSIG